MTETLFGPAPEPVAGQDQPQQMPYFKRVRPSSRVRCGDCLRAILAAQKAGEPLPVAMRRNPRPASFAYVTAEATEWLCYVHADKRASTQPQGQ